MQGLEALLKVRKISEDKALKALSLVKREYESVRQEEQAILAQSSQAKAVLNDLQKSAFDVRDSLLYRRYLNMLRNRLGRCHARRKKIQVRLDREIKKYEAARHGREAIDDLIAQKKAGIKAERDKREERLLSDAGQRQWYRMQKAEATT